MADGVVSTRSAHSVDEAVARLADIFTTKGITLFAIVDHSGEAAKAGLSMRPTKLMIFGNPKGGTPVMVAAPTAAIDLPLKLLVWEDEQRVVWISWNSADYLSERHAIPVDLVKNIDVASGLAKAAAE